MNKKQIKATKTKFAELIEENDSIIWIPLTDNLLENIDFTGKFRFGILPGKINVF